MSSTQQTAQRIPTLKDALRYVTRIRKLFEGEPSNYEYFKSSLFSCLQEKIDERTLILRMEDLFREYPDIRNEFYWYCSQAYWNTHRRTEPSPPLSSVPPPANNQVAVTTFIVNESNDNIEEGGWSGGTVGGGGGVSGNNNNNGCSSGDNIVEMTIIENNNNDNDNSNKDNDNNNNNNDNQTILMDTDMVYENSENNNSNYWGSYIIANEQQRDLFKQNFVPQISRRFDNNNNNNGMTTPTINAAATITNNIVAPSFTYEPPSSTTNVTNIMTIREDQMTNQQPLQMGLRINEDDGIFLKVKKKCLD